MSSLVIIISNISFLKKSVFDNKSVRTSLFSCNIVKSWLRCHLIRSSLKLLFEYINFFMQRKLAKTRQNEVYKIASLIVDWLRSSYNFSKILWVIEVLFYLLCLSWSWFISVTIFFSIELLNTLVILKLILIWAE